MGEFFLGAIFGCFVGVLVGGAFGEDGGERKVIRAQCTAAKGVVVNVAGDKRCWDEKSRRIIPVTVE